MGYHACYGHDGAGTDAGGPRAIGGRDIEPERYERRWETRRRAGKPASEEAQTSYYGLPVIHRPHWKWLIIGYFFLGGISSASYVIASIASLLGGPDNDRVARTARYVSLAALLPCPLLLVLDLGRPTRFLNMLRMLKISSPMSVGSWTLLLFSQFCAASAARQASHDGFLRRFGPLPRLINALPPRVIGALGLAPAFALSGYTGALLAATAVPLWTKRHLLMGPLFMASAFSSATAAVTLALTAMRGTNHRTLQRLEQIELTALWTELCLLLTLERSLGATIARPLITGRLGRVYRFGVLGCGIALPLALRAVGQRIGGRWASATGVLASLLALCGGFLLRYVMVVGGSLSADDPYATFEMTRRQP